MSDKARNHLVNIRDELRDFRERCRHVHGRFGFSIIASTSTESCPPEVWPILSGMVIRTRTSERVPVEVATNWTEPFLHGLQCFWWWGNQNAVGQFCNWAERASVALREFRDSLPELASGRGHFQTLPTLCAVALAKNLGDPPLVENRILLDATGFTPAQRWRLPTLLRAIQPPPVFRVLDVCTDGATLASEVLDCLLGSGVSRFVVDVTARCVTWKGQDYPVTKEQALFLDLLNNHPGKGPMTEAACMAACPQLPNGHFRRNLWKPLPKPLRDITKSRPGFGWYLQLD